MQGTRLNKYIASSGLCSRRKADELIESGVVTVNGNNQYTVTLNVPTGYTYSENVTNVIIPKRIYGLYN